MRTLEFICTNMTDQGLITISAQIVGSKESSTNKNNNSPLLYIVAQSGYFTKEDALNES